MTLECFEFTIDEFELTEVEQQVFLKELLIKSFQPVSSFRQEIIIDHVIQNVPRRILAQDIGLSDSSIARHEFKGLYQAREKGLTIL